MAEHFLEEMVNLQGKTITSYNIPYYKDGMMKDINKEYKIACKRTFNFDTKTLDTIKNEKAICIMGDLENMIVDKDTDNKPNFFHSLESGLSKEKEDLMFSFYERYTHRDRYTHFIVPVSQKPYYQDFVGDLYKTDYDFICRIRNEVVYTIGFLNSSDGIDGFEQDMEKALSMKACSDESVNFLVELEKKYAAVCKVYTLSGEKAKSLTEQEVNIINSENYKVESIVPNNILFTYYDDKTDYFDQKKFAKNFEKSKAAFAQRFGGGKRLKYNLIIMNPPYGSIGGPVTTEAKKYANRTVCLMPLSCYKKKSDELWRYVVSMELADPKMFVDATITDNLCICTLVNEMFGFKTYEDMEIISFNHKATPFFNRNKLLNPCFRTYFETTMSSDVVFDNTYTFATTWRISVNNVQETKTGWDYKYNVTKELKDIPVHDRKDGTGKMYMAWILDFGKGHETSCKNFNTWWWYKGKHGLCAFLIKSLNKKSGTIEQAIPRIDWEGISDHPLWKEGEYDEAVLDAMGLKWDGDVIVEK